MTKEVIQKQAKKDDKNARSSHQQVHAKKGKIGLFGKSMSRAHAHEELLADALELKDVQEGAYDDEVFSYQQ